MNQDPQRKDRARLEAYKELSQRLEYVDGKLIWRDTYARFLGREAGATDALGYKRVFLKRGIHLSAHRLIFFMHHGWLPENVDHIDGDRTNNRIENLRAATLCQNARNCKVPVRNTSGVKGVYWHRQLNRWTASIRVEKKLTHLGTFDSIFDAACARKSAEQEHYGEFAR